MSYKMVREVEVDSLSLFWGAKSVNDNFILHLNHDHTDNMTENYVTPTEAVLRIAEVLGVNITLGGEDHAERRGGHGLSESVADEGPERHQPDRVSTPEG